MKNMFRLFLFILSVCLWCTACRPGKDEQLSHLFASVGLVLYGGMIMKP